MLVIESVNISKLFIGIRLNKFLQIACKMKSVYILTFYNTREDNDPNIIFSVCPLKLIESVTLSFVRFFRKNECTISNTTSFLYSIHA